MIRCLTLALKGNYIAIQEIVYAIETGNITPEDIETLEAKPKNTHSRYLNAMLILFGKPGEQGDITSAFTLLTHLADEEDSSWAKVMFYIHWLLESIVHTFLQIEKEFY